MVRLRQSHAGKAYQGCHPPPPFKANLVGKLFPLGIKKSIKSYRRKKQRVRF
jgi:hypothetical protein